MNFSLLTQILRFRFINLAVFLACTGLIAIAYYMEYIMYLEPCPLCMVQRIIVILIGIVCLIAFLHNPQRRGKHTYSTIALILSAGGIAAASRHVWLQNAPADKIPECFAGIGIILANNPMFDALKIIFSGTGECAETAWVFLGLSIPGWTLVAFIAFAIIMIIQIIRTAISHAHG